MTCIFPATAMKNHSFSESKEKKFSYTSYDYNVPNASLRDKLTHQQYAIAEMFKDAPRANDLCERYNADDLKKAENDQRDLISWEQARIHDTVHEQCVDPVARSEYHDATNKEQEARKQLKVIQQAIEFQQRGKCTEQEDSSDDNSSSDCVIL